MPRGPKIWEVTFGREFLLDGELVSEEKAIILALAGWSDFYLCSDPTKEQLAAKTKIGERKLRDHVNHLESLGYIDVQRVRMRGRNRNIYRLLSPCRICTVKRGKSIRQILPRSIKDSPTALPPAIGEFRSPRKSRLTVIPFPQSENESLTSAVDSR